MLLLKTRQVPSQPLVLSGLCVLVKLQKAGWDKRCSIQKALESWEGFEFPEHPGWGDNEPMGAQGIPRGEGLCQVGSTGGSELSLEQEAASEKLQTHLWESTWILGRAKRTGAPWWAQRGVPTLLRKTSKAG